MMCNERALVIAETRAVLNTDRNPIWKDAYARKRLREQVVALLSIIEQKSADEPPATHMPTEGNKADTPCPPHRWLRLGVIGDFTPNPDDPCDHCGRTYAELTTKPAPANARYSNVSELLHNYKPHRKYPWFCSECGYPESESLKHPQKNLGNINGPGCDPDVT